MLPLQLRVPHSAFRALEITLRRFETIDASSLSTNTLRNSSSDVDAESGALPDNLAHNTIIDTDLACVVAAWPTLPEAIKTAIKALTGIIT